jgi:hypothetical protein
MPHLHYCDLSGHGHMWECYGDALRLDAGDQEPSPCICPIDGLPLERGSHSSCCVELLVCQNHREARQRQYKLRTQDYSVGPESDKVMGEILQWIFGDDQRP